MAIIGSLTLLNEFSFFLPNLAQVNNFGHEYNIEFDLFEDVAEINKLSV